MQYLLRFLLAPSMALWKYCLCIAPLAIVPSVLLFILAILLADAVGVDVAAYSGPAREATLTNISSFGPRVTAVAHAALRFEA